MPAPILYLSTRDIEGILHISHGEAHDIMQEFIARKQAVVRGRLHRVSVVLFAQWISKLDGSDPQAVRMQIQEAMRSEKNI